MTPEQMYVGFISDLITLVPSLLIVWLFKHVRSHRSAYESWVINYHSSIVDAKALEKDEKGKEKTTRRPDAELTQVVPRGWPRFLMSRKQQIQAAETETFANLAKESSTGSKLREETRRKNPPSLDQLRDALVDEDELSESDSLEYVIY